MTEVTPAVVTPWHQGVEGFDAETIGHIQTKGWDKLDAPKAALQAVKAWKEAERYVGVPANQIVRLPTDANDEPGWKAVWARLGAPADAKDYDFSTVKIGGKDIDAALQETFRTAAASAHLPKDAATRVAAGLAKYLESSEAAKLAEHTAAVEKEREALNKNWGANKDVNLVVAKNAAAALGVTPADVEALEKIVGYSRVMEIFRNIGTKIGEDKFVSNNGGGTPGVMTKEQAVARKAELMKDSAWADRYMKGGSAENREMTSLIKIITAE